MLILLTAQPPCAGLLSQGGRTRRYEGQIRRSTRDTRKKGFQGDDASGFDLWFVHPRSHWQATTSIYRSHALCGDNLFHSSGHRVVLIFGGSRHGWGIYKEEPTPRLTDLQAPTVPLIRVSRQTQIRYRSTGLRIYHRGVGGIHWKHFIPLGKGGRKACDKNHLQMQPRY